jgi:hypothetical protein
LPSLDSASSSGFVPHNRSKRGLLLALELLDCSGWLLGRKVSCLIVLTLVLISSLLVALTVLLLLLLLRKLPLVLVLMLTLMLVTLLEVLGWVA